MTKVIKFFDVDEDVLEMKAERKTLRFKSYSQESLQNAVDLFFDVETCKFMIEAMQEFINNQAENKE